VAQSHCGLAWIRTHTSAVSLSRSSSSSGYTDVVKAPRWIVSVAAALAFVASGCAGMKLHCRQRNADLTRRIENIKRDAHEQLKIGTKKADVARFYTEHQIPFNV